MYKISSKSFVIKPADYKKVVDYFDNHHDNGTPTIAKKLKLPYDYVSYILDVFISKKRNYNGEIPRINAIKNPHKNNKPIRVYDLDDKLVGEYKSITECSSELGVQQGVISCYLRGFGNGTVARHWSGKKYRYELVEV